jgi:hypothetical protein
MRAIERAGETTGSVGELVARVYDELSRAVPGDDALAARLTAHAVERWLVREGRADLVRRLAEI